MVQKLLLLPAFAIVCMMLLALVADRSARERGMALDTVATVLWPQMAKIDRAVQMQAQVHVDLFRVVNWASNSTDAEKIVEYSTRVSKGLRQLHEVTEALGTSWLTGHHDAAESQAVAVALESYGTAAGAVLRMASKDPVTAFIMMMQAERRFEQLKVLFDDMRNAHVASTSLALDASRLAELRARTMFLILVAVAIGSSVVFSAALARSVARPITAMARMMTALAAGQLRMTIPGAGRGDEIGSMAKAVLVFRDSMATAARLAAEREAERASSAARSARIEDLGRCFSADMAELVSVLSNAAGQMRQTAEQMNSAAGLANERSAVVAKAAQGAGEGVALIASAAGKLSESITEVGARVIQSTAITQAAVLQASRTDEVVRSLYAGAQRIGAVVTLIERVAGKTNLLALNATIEAARAGTAGRGFAVVAGEVKSLAAQTAQATAEIATQITAIQSSIVMAVEAITQIHQTISAVGVIASDVSSSVQEQGRSMAAIAGTARRVAQDTGQVARTTDGLRDDAAVTGTAAQHVLYAAADLYGQSEQITRKMEQYLANVKAA